MPIQEQNIRFVASQVLDDVPEGGGAATGNEIEDGVMNNLFEDISDLDRALGRFNLRKIFLAVRTLSTDLFGGAKSVITALPEDEALNYALFTTKDAFDQREDAANRVESYLFKGPIWAGYLYGNHITGMTAISVIQRVGTDLPPIGKTLALVQNEEEPSEFEQYIRVIDVEAVTQTFTDGQGDFQRWIVQLTLSAPLVFDFNGHEVRRYDSSYDYNGKVRLRDTTVADATKFYGSQKLAEAGAIGDLKVKAKSIFTSIVPAAQTETPLVGQPLNPQAVVRLENNGRPVEIPQQGQTRGFDVTAENRRLNWVATILPIPAPESLTISYLSQGRWYKIQDDGQGAITGRDPSLGAGTVDYTNGEVSVTLGSLPDAETQIIFVWATPLLYEEITAAPFVGSEGTLSIPGSDDPIKKGTLQFDWTSDGVAKSATDDSNGAIVGDGSGTIDYFTGEYELSVDGNIVDPGTSITAQWDRIDGVGGTEASAPGVTATATKAPLKPGSVIVNLNVTLPDNRGVSNVRANDNGSGSIVWSNSGQDRFMSGWRGESGNIIGSIDYTTGDITMNQYVEVYEQASFGPGIGTSSFWQTNTATAEITDVGVGAQSADYTDGTAPTAPVSGQAILTVDASGGLVVKITQTQERLVPNSLRFDFKGDTYEDRNGDIVYQIQGDGSATVAGSVDYSTSEISLFGVDTAASGALVLTSGVKVIGEWATSEATFRTANAPLAPESLQILATTEDGEQLTGFADNDGNFNEEWITGKVNYQVGTARVEFGKYVVDANLTTEEKAEWWYNAADVENDGTIWKPRRVLPGATTYNAVAFKFIPLDASILGINPVRLPSDGRVPVFRAGDVAMVMHPQTTAPATVADNDVITTRPRIAWVRLLNADGTPITEGYTLDRATGDVTITDTTDMTNPITVTHTVGDLRLVTDAQITGEIGLSRELTHNYPANESIIGTCLLHGDRRARVSETWDETTWNNEWNDFQVGDSATANLNLIDFPITVTNEGCDTERWVFRVTNSSSNQWELISENRGLVWQGTYEPGGADVAPINPRTRVLDTNTGTYVGGTPYLTIPGNANGGGWSTGNIVRINTVGAIADMWLARAVQQSDEPAGAGEDGAEIYALGNIDRP